MSSLLSKFEGALLGTCIGDALGMPLEGMSIDEIKSKYGRVTEFLDGRLPKGSYTDDTEMMIAVAEAILERGLDINHIAMKLAKSHNFERGYGPGTLYILRSNLRGKSWTEISPKIFGSGSFGNGCVVRSTPIILLLHKYASLLDTVLENTCKITHAHKFAIEGVKIFAKALTLALSGKKDGKEYIEAINNVCQSKVFSEKFKMIGKMLSEEYSEKDVVKLLGNGVEVYNSLPIAIYSYLKFIDSFRESVIYAVNLGGDSDSIGAITGCLSGALHGSDNIPEMWRYDVEAYDKLIRLANELYELHRIVDDLYWRFISETREKFVGIT